MEIDQQLQSDIKKDATFFKANRAFISVNDVCFSYKTAKCDNRLDVLSDVSFNINRGEFVAVLGKNGVGKSTLVKLLTALIVPTSGNIFIDGQNTKNKATVRSVRSKIGVVMQDPGDQIVNSIVEEDVAFGPENLLMSTEKIRASVDNALNLVGMQNYKNSEIGTLSGGQKQRVALAGVLAMNPECIILDEATSSIDIKSKNKILGVMSSLNKKNNITIIMITHSTKEALLADRILFLDEGSVAVDMASGNFFDNDAVLKKFRLTPPDVVKFLKNLKRRGISFVSNIKSDADCISTLAKFL